MKKKKSVYKLSQIYETREIKSVIDTAQAANNCNRKMCMEGNDEME